MTTTPLNIRTSRRAPAQLLALVLAVLTAVAVAPTAVAVAPTSSATPSNTPTVPVMVVLDASGSMNQTDAPGPRIDAAKAAVTSLIDSLPTQTQVGLQVYGTGTGSTDAEKAAGCTDIKTLAPVGPLDAAALKTKVSAVTASGYTPIGNALRAAADALPNEGPRSIVLVSDGEDTCAPPAPCDVAKELKQQGIDLVIHTVGFKVDITARDQLSCIATETGGTYSDANDAAQLDTALQKKVDYALTGYTPQGTRITGDDQPTESAPLLAPGQYVDTYDHGWAAGDNMGQSGAGTTKYYTIAAKDGVTPYISATLIPPTNALGRGDVGALGVDLTLLAKDLTTCGDDRGFVIANSERREPATALLGGRAFGSSEFGSRCRTEGVLILEVERIGEAWTGQPLPMEIVVRMEPPADASTLAPAADKGPMLAAPTHGTATPVQGGDSFNDAPELISGTTYSDTLVTGENRFYRIPLAWGQRFSYLITPSGPADPVLSSSAITWVDVFNPVRDSVDMTAFSSSGSLWFVERAPEPFTASTVYPVRYTNRDTSASRSYSLDGDYYLRLNADVKPADQTSSVPFQITVVVSGDAEPGPVYQAAGVATSSTTEPSKTSTATSTPPTSSGDTAPTNTADTTSTAGSASTDSGVPGWIWAVVAAFAAGAVAALLFVRFRRRPTHSSATTGPHQQGDLR